MTKPILFFVCLFFSLQATSAQITNDSTIDLSSNKLAERYLKLLQQHYANGDYQLHKAYSDSLLLVAKANGLTKMHVLALVNQAVFHNNRSSRLKSIELYHEALAQCEKIPEDFRSKTVVLVNMGNTYNNIGSYDKAIATMGKVLAVAERTENSDHVKAAALIGLANNYHELKNYEKTLEYANKAKVLGEETKNEITLASSFNSIIDVYLNIKEYDKALEMGKEALKLPISKKPTKKRGWLLLNMGIANYHVDELDTALDYLKGCVNLAQDKGLLEIEMYGQEYLARVHEQKKDFKASHTAQKEYALLRDRYLQDKKEASNADLKKDIVLKDEKLSQNNQQLLAFSNKRKQILIGGTMLFLVLTGLLFFFIKRKKAIEIETTKLRAQYIGLQQTLNEDKNGAVNISSGKEPEENSQVTPYKNSSLTPSTRQEFKKKILDFMESEKPYLNPNLNQSDLAGQIGISTHHFSEVLHYSFEQNFYNFMNSYRVIEAQKLMKSINYKDVKLIAIAFDSGFKSKTSFFRVFKKHTGQTPSEFRSKI
ncbi:MAG: hypothetical protein Mars2KO_30900 [Maribacter sp.]